MSSVIIAGDTSGTVTLQAPSAAGSTVITLPATSGTLLQSGTLVTEAQGGTGTTAGYYGFKNRLINGAMGISQRAAVGTNVAITTNAAGTFGPDRFTGYTGTSSLWNISQVSTSAYDFPYAMRIQRIAGQTSTSAVYARQVIETVNCKDLAGQTVTLSFYVTAGANYSGGVVNTQIYAGTGEDQGTSSLNSATWTGFTAPLSEAFTPTTTRTRFSFTTTIGATDQELAFGMNWSGSGTAGANDYLDITGVQLEKGSTATSFDYRPYGTELQLCQRYYEKSYNINVAPAAASEFGGILHRPPSTALNITVPFKVEKRASPTVTVYSPVTGTSSKFRNYTTSADLSIGGVAFIGMWGATPYSDASTANNQYGFQFTAESEL